MSNDLSTQRRQYEDPFLDMASTVLPKSFRKMQELCQIFAITHPQIGPAIYRMAEYPVTSLQYAGDPEAIRLNKQVFEKEIKILDRHIEFGLDYFGYGNCFVTISFPFMRWYVCSMCQKSNHKHDVKTLFVDGSQLKGNCPSCGANRVVMQPHDQYVRRARGINVYRIPPQLITIKSNSMSGDVFYFQDMPKKESDAIRMGDRDIIDTTPKDFLTCVLKGLKMQLHRIFHFKRPTLSGRDMEWGLPLMIPALKDAYFNQILKKADEMIANEHAVPLRILFPEAGTQDPLTKIAMGPFQNFLKRGLRDWREDKNLILTAPLPIGAKVIGGDAAAYRTVEQRQYAVEEIIGAMMTTKGFILGNENWSAASITQRQMENSFLNYGRRSDDCLQWIADEVQAFLQIPWCSLKMKPFRKVDDIQMANLVVGLAREQKVSWGEALSRMDIDADVEIGQIEKELARYTRITMQSLLGQTEAAAKGAVMQAQAQMEAEGATAVLTQQSEQSQAGLQQLVSGAGNIAALADKLQMLPPAQRGQAMVQLRAMRPDLATPLMLEMNRRTMGQLGTGATLNTAGQGPGGQGAVDMRPPPTQLPPRRTP